MIEKQIEKKSLREREREIRNTRTKSEKDEERKMRGKSKFDIIMDNKY